MFGWISQFEALSDVQLSVADSPLVIDPGVTDTLLVGADGAGAGAVLPPKRKVSPAVYSQLYMTLLWFSKRNS